MSFFKRLFGRDAASGDAAVAPTATDPEAAAESHWQQVYAARKHTFTAAFGEFPQDILKMGDLLGIWPGGGLYVIPAPPLGTGAVIYTSFGLTNPDMPATLTVTDLRTESSAGQMTRTEGTMQRRENPRAATQWPGYGYEIIVAARENAEWPLWLLQWAVKAEMLKDADLRGLVEKYDGLTVVRIQVGEQAFVNLLIAKAQAPFLTGFDLPNGRAELLVATVITDDEMHWSKEHGRIALLAALHAAGIGQFSVLDRQSVVSEGPFDFADVTSREQMMALAESGTLHKILLFPAECGGDDVAMNWTFVPAAAARLKDAVTDLLIEAIKAGDIDKLDVRPEYKGNSFVPARIHVVATHSAKSGGFTKTIEVW